MKSDSSKWQSPNEAADAVDRVIRLWQRTLRIDDIGPDDDFFELGGNSISAVRLIPLLKDEFEVEPTIVVFFDHPTPRMLAHVLVAEGVHRQSPGRVARPPSSL